MRPAWPRTAQGVRSRHRLGWSPQVPQRRAAERDEEAIATWVKETWPLAEQRRGTRTHGSACR
ncbi:winged helix-turn-helix domain-containing protein [Nonomuraea sp. NPDC048882]|uniref:winged helix-turn-helix domain-containing protein n=1 Tax=Nonomuraea sp. NPDC048882 TaxID=3154347 RepID=UPI0033CD1E8E